MRCILDLGTQKTASKCRQRFFAAEGARIVTRRFCYPSSGRVGAWHRPLYEALRRGDPAPLRAAAAEAESAGADLVILSYEELHKLDTRAIERLAASFPELDAVVFLRRQDQFINSFHNQLHKSHRVSLAELAAFEGKLADYDPHLDFDAMLARWSRVLGPQRVHPVRYDKQVSPVSAFFAAVDIALELAGYEEPRPNPAIDGFGLAVLRAVKQRLADVGHPDPVGVMREAHQRLAAHFVTADGAGEVDTLGPALRARILAHYQAGNDGVRARFFPELDRLFPPLSPGPATDAPAPAADDAQLLRMADAIIAAVQPANRG